MNVEHAFAPVRSPDGRYVVSAYAWEEFVDITLANAETHETIFHHNFVQEADPIVTERNVKWAEDSSSFTVRYNSLLSARETKCIYQYVIEPATFSLTCEGKVVPQADSSLNSP